MFSVDEVEVMPADFLALLAHDASLPPLSKRGRYIRQQRSAERGKRCYREGSETAGLWRKPIRSASIEQREVILSTRRFVVDALRCACATPGSDSFRTSQLPSVALSQLVVACHGLFRPHWHFFGLGRRLLLFLSHAPLCLRTSPISRLDTTPFLVDLMLSSLAP